MSTKSGSSRPLRNAALDRDVGVPGTVLQCGQAHPGLWRVWSLRFRPLSMFTRIRPSSSTRYQRGDRDGLSVRPHHSDHRRVRLSKQRHRCLGKRRTGHSRLLTRIGGMATQGESDSTGPRFCICRSSSPPLTRAGHFTTGRAIWRRSIHRSAGSKPCRLSRGRGPIPHFTCGCRQPHLSLGAPASPLSIDQNGRPQALHEPVPSSHHVTRLAGRTSSAL